MVFIGLCGLSFAGKATLARLLHDDYNFTVVRVSKEPSPEATTGRTLHFETVDGMLDWIMCRWREDFVWPEVETVSDYEAVSCRPFFMLVHVQAPVQHRLLRAGSTDPLAFIARDDSCAFRTDGLLHVARHATLTILNSGTERQLRGSLCRLGLASTVGKLTLTRPDWDSYFMQIAEFSARRTNCMKRGVGAVLVKDMRIVATGYNGTARGLQNCLSGGCARCNSNTRSGMQLDICLCLHAEENALLEAGRARSQHATLYSTMAPCLNCARKICQMDLRRVVYRLDYNAEHFTPRLLAEAGIALEKFAGGPQTLIDCSSVPDLDLQELTVELTKEMSELQQQ